MTSQQPSAFPDEEAGSGPGHSARPAGDVYDSTDITWQREASWVPTGPLTMVFSSDGRHLVTTMGANYYWFDSSLADAHLVVTGPVAVTAITPPEHVAAAERWLLDQLAGRPRWALDDQRLILTTDTARVSLQRRQPHAKTHQQTRPVPDFSDPMSIQNAPLRGSMSTEFDRPDLTPW